MKDVLFSMVNNCCAGYFADLQVSTYKLIKATMEAFFIFDINLM
jgi:hypothetical protein